MSAKRSPPTSPVVPNSSKKNKSAAVRKCLKNSISYSDELSESIPFVKFLDSLNIPIQSSLRDTVAESTRKKRKVTICNSLLESYLFAYSSRPCTSPPMFSCDTTRAKIVVESVSESSVNNRFTSADTISARIRQSPRRRPC